MASSWKKLLYSNKGQNTNTGDNPEPQLGITPEDLTSIYITTDNDGSGNTGYLADGAFSNTPGAPLVLKRVSNTTGTNPSLYDKEENGAYSQIFNETPAGTLVWGKGAEENTVLVQTPDTATGAILTPGTLPVASQDYGIIDSVIVQDFSGYSGSGANKTFNVTGLNTSDTSFSTGNAGITGQTVAITGNTDATVFSVDSDKFTIKGNDGDTNIAGTLTVGQALTASSSATIAGTTTIGSANSGDGADATIHGSLTLSSNPDGNNPGELSVASTASIGGTLNVTGIINANATTASDDISSGSLVVDGGVGIAKAVYIGELIDVAGNANLQSNLTVAGNTSLNGNVNLGNGASDVTTITGNLTHTGAIASLGNGAMEITKGATPTGITAGAQVSGVSENSTITINVVNASGSPLDDATDLAVDAQWWFISGDGEVVALEVATAPSEDLDNGANVDVVFDVIVWAGGSTDTVPADAVLYQESPAMASVSMTAGAIFSGETIIVDSTNTALTDNVVHINKNSGNNEYGSTADPVFVMGVNGSGTGSQANAMRMQFRNADKLVAFSHGTQEAPTTASEDVTTQVDSGYHSAMVRSLVLERGHGETIEHNGDSNSVAGTKGAAEGMIAIDGDGVPFIWIAAS